jgi:hypothetical protein
MIITKKRLEQLRQEICELKDEQSKDNGIIQRKLGNLSREILDIINPPKKGYIRFETTNGWCQFKKSKEKRRGK